MYKIILCDLINPINDRRCDLVRKGALVLKKQASKNKQSGSVEYRIVAYGSESDIIDTYGHKKHCVIDHRHGQLCLPGFIDTHFHWVQDDVRLMPKDSLLNWLENYTWPYEKKFKSTHYSLKRAKEFGRELLEVGTLGGAIYGSIHEHTVEHALNYFLGEFIVGNVLMTQNSPKYLTQSPKIAKSGMIRLAKKYGKQYAITPRFAPTTCPEVMKFGAEVSKKYGSFIQTHLSETTNEIEYVLSIFNKIKGFEKTKTYTDIYHKCNLLGPRTIFGHGIHLSQQELKRLSGSNSSLAHCPSSNAPVKQLGLGSGLFNFKKIENAKIHWALASDIGGGPFLSMFDVMRSFVDQNKRAKVDGASYTKAIYRATLAGAISLKKNKEIGSLDKNKWGNFILVPSPRNLKGEDAESVLRRLINIRLNYREDFQNLVLSSWVRGQEVFNRIN